MTTLSVPHQSMAYQLKPVKTALSVKTHSITFSNTRRVKASHIRIHNVRTPSASRQHQRTRSRVLLSPRGLKPRSSSQSSKSFCMSSRVNGSFSMATSKQAPSSCLALRRSSWAEETKDEGSADLLGRRRSGFSSGSPGSCSRGRRDRCLPASFVTPADFQTPASAHLKPPAGRDEDNCRRSIAATFAASAAAASVVLFIPPGSASMASAMEATQEQQMLIEALTPTHSSMVDDDGTEEAMIDELSNLGFLPVHSSSSDLELSVALEEATSTSRGKSLSATEPNAEAAADRPAKLKVSSVTSVEAPRLEIDIPPKPLDDTVAPLNRSLSSSLGSPAGPIQALPALYIPLAASSAAPSSSLSTKSDSQDSLLVPVVAGAAAAATLTSAAPASLIDAAATASSLLPSSAVETVAAAAEPVVAGAAAASEAVAAAAASVAEPVVASAAAAAASAGAGLSTKLSLIVAQSLQHLGVGGVAGATGAAVVYPLDTVKTRMQAQVKTKGDEEDPESDGEASSEESTDEQRPYKNEIDCMVRMVKEEGVGSLYSGIGPQLIGIAPEKAVKLAANEMLLAILEGLMPGTRVWMLELIAGGGGGAAQVVFTNPVEAVKVRLQAQRTGGEKQLLCTDSTGIDHVYSAGDVLKVADVPENCVILEEEHRPNTMEVVKELGLKGLYTGSALTLARDVPSTGLFFACYAFLTQPEQQSRFLEAAAGLSPLAYVFVASCISSIPAAILVTPLDVIKTRIQILPTKNVEVPRPLEVARKIIEEEGPAALFKGGMARALRVGPQLGITLVVYQWLCENWR